MQVTRRGLITGLTAFLAAPAIVRASSLMPVKALPDLLPNYLEPKHAWYMVNGNTAANNLKWVAADGSGDYYTISAALEDSKPGDTIMLSPGIYDANGIRVTKLTAVF